MKYTFSILTLIFSLSLLAQEEDVVEPKQGLHEIKAGVNVLKSARTALGTGRTMHELEGALGFNGWNLVADLGIEKNERSGNYSYQNDGSYYRIGIDRNFVKRVSSGNVLALGLRYAQASFDDRLIYSLDNGFGNQDLDLSNPNLTARWFELNFSLRGKIVAQLYTGFTMRWKFSRRISGEGMLKTFDIPGFGNTKRQNATSFDYYLMWRIPLKKSK